MAVLDTNVLVNYYFEEIAKIPHGSYHEKQLLIILKVLQMSMN